MVLFLSAKSRICKSFFSQTIAFYVIIQYNKVTESIKGSEERGGLEQ